nr:DUF6320 domain-containing protein [bacterium]
MSYCVNCGVEIQKGQKSCPLCGVAVINPAQPGPESAPPMYPPTPVTGYRDNYRDFIGPIAILLLIPALVSLICNVLTAHAVTWSAYVMAAIGLACVFVLFPLAFSRPRPALCIAVDTAATAAFLFLLQHLTHGRWFFSLGLPICLAAGLFVWALFCVLGRKRWGKLARAALALGAAGAFTLATDVFINLSLKGAWRVGWSLYAAVPCALLAAAALLVHHNRRAKEHMRRRFFI